MDVTTSRILCRPEVPGCRPDACSCEFWIAMRALGCLLNPWPHSRQTRGAVESTGSEKNSQQHCIPLMESRKNFELDIGCPVEEIQKIKWHGFKSIIECLYKLTLVGQQIHNIYLCTMQLCQMPKRQ